MRPGATVLVTLTDGSAVRGMVRRSWRWGVVKLADAQAVGPHGPSEITGHLLIPRRSVLVVQVM